MTPTLQPSSEEEKVDHTRLHSRQLKKINWRRKITIVFLAGNLSRTSCLTSSCWRKGQTSWSHSFWEQNMETCFLGQILLSQWLKWRGKMKKINNKNLLCVHCAQLEQSNHGVNLTFGMIGNTSRREFLRQEWFFNNHYPSPSVQYYSIIFISNWSNVLLTWSTEPSGWCPWSPGIPRTEAPGPPDPWFEKSKRRSICSLFFFFKLQFCQSFFQTTKTDRIWNIKA